MSVERTAFEGLKELLDRAGQACRDGDPGLDVFADAREAFQGLSERLCIAFVDSVLHYVMVEGHPVRIAEILFGAEGAVVGLEADISEVMKEVGTDVPPQRFSQWRASALRRLDALRESRGARSVKDVFAEFLAADLGDPLLQIGGRVRAFDARNPFEFAGPSPDDRGKGKKPEKKEQPAPPAPVAPAKAAAVPRPAVPVSAAQVPGVSSASAERTPPQSVVEDGVAPPTIAVSKKEMLAALEQMEAAAGTPAGGNSTVLPAPPPENPPPNTGPGSGMGTSSFADIGAELGFDSPANVSAGPPAGGNRPAEDPDTMIPDEKLPSAEERRRWAEGSALAQPPQEQFPDKVATISDACDVIVRVGGSRGRSLVQGSEWEILSDGDILCFANFVLVCARAKYGTDEAALLDSWKRGLVAHSKFLAAARVKENFLRGNVITLRRVLATVTGAVGAALIPAIKGVK